MAACALSANTREDEYHAERKKWNQADLAVFAEALDTLISEMESAPFSDLLGPLYMDTLGTSQKRGGEFHSPQSVSRLVASICSRPIPPEGPILLSEPSCGAGATILSFAESIPRSEIHRLRVDAWDIARVACDICFINTTLWNIPAIITHGCTLTRRIWRRWVNFPMINAAPLSWHKYASS